MAITPVTAYQNVLPSATQGLGALSKESTGASFGDFLADAANNQVSSLQSFEKAIHGSTTGQVSELDLIHAVNEADISLQAFKVAWEKFLQKYETIVEKTTI